MAEKYSGKALLENEMLEWEIQSFGGVDYSADAALIAENRSPDMVNLLLDSTGSLRKRPGYKKLFANAVEGSSVEGPRVEMIQEMPDGSIVFCSGARLYRYDPHAENPATVWIGALDTTPCACFLFNEELFLLDGNALWRYNGTTLAKASESAYVPLYLRNLPPFPSEWPVYEQINLLSPFYRVQFNTSSTETTYAIPNLDANGTVVEVKYQGQVLADSEYTVSDQLLLSFPEPLYNLTNALEVKVCFSNATINKNQSKINGCRVCGIFGGENDTRVFLGGSATAPATDYYSDLYDPTYFAADAYTTIGSDDDPIMAYSLQYDTMIIHKKRSTWNRRFEIVDGKALYSIRPVNDYVGLFAPKSVQLLDNAPVMLTENGVYCLVGGKVRDERNMEHISERVDKRLLQEANLEKAVSFDFQGLYGLGLNGKVYLYDYRRKEWLYWEGIPAISFLATDERLYFGSTDGRVYVFCQEGEADCFFDDGQAYRAAWRSKNTALGAERVYKMAKRLGVIFTEQAAINSAALTFEDDRNGRKILKGCRWRLHDFGDMDFEDFSFILNTMPKVFNRRLQAKRLLFCNILVENETGGEGMAISGLSFFYQLEKPKLR